MINNLRLLTLSENTVRGQGLLAEWGLSILIETDEGNILLDAGAGVSTVYNADVMGVDLTKIDKMVLSHGHSDHTGGLRELLRRRKKELEIICHPDVFASKWGRTTGHPDTYAGVPYRLEELESLGAKFTLTKESVKLTPDILTTGEVPMVTDFEAVERRLYEKENGEFRPDLFFGQITGQVAQKYIHMSTSNQFLLHTTGPLTRVRPSGRDGSNRPLTDASSRRPHWPAGGFYVNGCYGPALSSRLKDDPGVHRQGPVLVGENRVKVQFFNLRIFIHEFRHFDY